MIADKTFLRFIEVQVADEYDAGSHNHWRITIYNGTAQDSTQLCHTNFMRYKYLIIFHWKYEFITKLLRFSFFIKKTYFLQGNMQVSGEEANIASGQDKNILVNVLAILSTLKTFQVLYQ